MTPKSDDCYGGRRRYIVGMVHGERDWGSSSTKQGEIKTAAQALLGKLQSFPGATLRLVFPQHRYGAEVSPRDAGGGVSEHQSQGGPRERLKLIRESLCCRLYLARLYTKTSGDSTFTPLTRQQLCPDMPRLTPND